MSQSFHELPLADCALSFQEACTLKAHLDGLHRFLSRPGDWGFDTQLGRLTIAVKNVQASTGQHIQAIREAHPGL